MNKTWWLVAGAIAVAIFAGLGWKHERDLARLDARLHSAVVTADSARAAATRVISQARIEVADARLRASRAEAQAARAYRDTVVLSVPDTCKPVVAKLQHAFTVLDSAYQSEKASGARLQATLTATADTLADVRNQLANVSNVSTSVVHKQESFWYRITPKLSIGAQAGMGITGRPYAGVGFNFGWKL